ncbi:hypothetical protein BIFGAL_03316 [Bifidobacterium gallicum DSM 20093 = LMG 11596]|uniref:Uncharacterized protein n=1 Tax=Bifidobacterium gallicum DSM 20093 = LMG 11596 TaxID=561180 RepID=D1NTZ5_9BIFI|nr:hypothetical protein BIFGAL_03316 [Bifidobacterium gallicum DSM 20093 = LMG 11596]
MPEALFNIIHVYEIYAFVFCDMHYYERETCKTMVNIEGILCKRQRIHTVGQTPQHGHL